MAISFVDSDIYALNNGSSMDRLLPTTLEDDLVIVAFAVGDNDSTDYAMSMSTSGYTMVPDTELFVDGGTYDINIAVFYKFMGPTPDTRYATPELGGADASVAMCATVFRGVDKTTPFDATATNAYGSGTGDADPPSITLSGASGVWTLVFVANAGAAGQFNSFVAPADYAADFETVATNDITDITLAAGYNDSPSNPEDPPTFTSVGNVVWVGITLALLPAGGGVGSTGQVKVYTGSSFEAKPVKVYNGSTWETKPVKVYNGSTWEETGY